MEYALNQVKDHKIYFSDIKKNLELGKYFLTSENYFDRKI